MTQILTLEQLIDYQQRIDGGSLEQVRQVYAELYAKGYNYAGWALGVANGNTLTGLAALDFLKGTALMGLDSASCRDLSPSTVNLIRYQMGQAYIATLISTAREENRGYLNHDVSFNDTRDFHRDVFNRNGLTLSNWTLNTPMELVRLTEGSTAVEALWQRIRDTGGEGLNGTVASVTLLNMVGRLSFSDDPKISEMAQQWIDTVPGVANLRQMGKSIELFGQWLFADSSDDAVNKEASAPLVMKVVLDPVDGQTKIIRNTSHVIDPDVAEGPNTYIVRKGDSLWKIAIENGWDFDALKAANAHLSDPNFIRAGQRINGLAPMESASALSTDNLMQLLNADRSVQVARLAGLLGRAEYESFTDWAAGQFAGNVGLHAGGGVGLQPPANPWLDFDLDLDPIGAFYESSDAASDSAGAIADKTPVLLDDARRRLRASALQAREANGDNKLTGTELQGLSVWADANENGILDGGELQTPEQAGIATLRAHDYEFHARGGGVVAGGPSAAPVKGSDAAMPARVDRTSVAPNSNYRTLRDTDNLYFPASGGYIVWSAGQIKINFNNRSYLIGTDGNDSFDGNYYAAYKQYFNNSLLQNFLAGGGDDVMGGSVRNDRLWGGTGNDLLFGYEGDDQLLGEEGNDELQGMQGNDSVDGGAGDDLLFGQVGNDVLSGGDGNDTLSGFTAANEAKQTLAVGETDNDWLYGGSGADQLIGGVGNDYLDGGNEADMLFGGDGHDTAFGGAGTDEINGDAGNDKLLGEDGNDRIFGEVGDDLLWGGAGDDVLVGFTASNDLKQALVTGETDDDALYGGLGDDRLFGQVGNDVLYGGEGDDLLVGFTGANEAQQSLNSGETDDDCLYGGAGADVLLGGAGKDFLDGGAGADDMEGGIGDDTYIVNSVNDVILEHADEGHDTVYSSVNYLLNADIEDLHLLQGFDINGTGNSRDNLIVGNGSDNIIDGVTGADTMIGGSGDDTYYVDDAGDAVVEYAGEGIDTIQSKISATLGDHIENLNLLDFSKPERGLVNGRAVLVYGFPKANELDYMQGDAIPEFKGTCALTSIANLLVQSNAPTTEGEVVQRAIDNRWAVTDAALDDYQRGGSNYQQQQDLLDSYGMRNAVLSGYNEHAVANLVHSGRGLLIGLNAGKLWDDARYLDDGGVNHVVTVTGVAYAEDNGKLMGFYIADSGRQRVSDMTRFVSLEAFRSAAAVPNAYSIYTIEAIKVRDEDVNGAGNALDNLLIGNRGNNILDGGAGNDTLYGGAGNDVLIGGSGADTYVFNRGDGSDLIREFAVEGDQQDFVRFGQGISHEELWFRRVAESLEISVLGSTDSLLFEGWYSNPSRRIGQFQTGDGLKLAGGDVEAMVSAMETYRSISAGIAPPGALQQSSQLALAQQVATSWR